MLQNKVAVVTGGTRGIGLATVKKFLANGASVAVCGSRQETAEKAVTALKEEFPHASLLALWPDLGKPEEVAQAFAKVKDTFGQLNILVNNAGISQRQSIYEYDPADFQKTMNINVVAMFNCSQAAARIMKEQGGGVILNTSSMVSIYGQAAGCGYPASKFAVNGLTKSLARELGKDHIRVNAVAPGVIRTDMVAALPPEMVKRLEASIPYGRVGEPEDIANAFLFLASDMASYVTGEILSVDGAAMT